MKIAVDYDDTFTADKVMFTNIINLFLCASHEVVFVTYRCGSYVKNIHDIENKDIETDANELDISIIYTSGNQKQHCYDADIWIDDSPITIPCYQDLFDMQNGCKINRDTQKLY